VASCSGYVRVLSRCFAEFRHSARCFGTRGAQGETISGSLFYRLRNKPLTTKEQALFIRKRDKKKNLSLGDGRGLFVGGFFTVPSGLYHADDWAAANLGLALVKWFRFPNSWMEHVTGSSENSKPGKIFLALDTAKNLTSHLVYDMNIPWCAVKTRFGLYSELVVPFLFLGDPVAPHDRKSLSALTFSLTFGDDSNDAEKFAAPPAVKVSGFHGLKYVG